MSYNNTGNNSSRNNSSRNNGSRNNGSRNNSSRNNGSRNNGSGNNAKRGSYSGNGSRRANSAEHAHDSGNDFLTELFCVLLVIVVVIVICVIYSKKNKKGDNLIVNTSVSTADAGTLQSTQAVTDSAISEEIPYTTVNGTVNTSDSSISSGASANIQVSTTEAGNVSQSQGSDSGNSISNESGDQSDASDGSIAQSDGSNNSGSADGQSQNGNSDNNQSGAGNGNSNSASAGVYVSADNVYDYLKTMKPSAFGLSKDFDSYTHKIDTWTTNVQSTECIGISLYDGDSLAASIYISTDGKSAYYIDEFGEAILAD